MRPPDSQTGLVSLGGHESCESRQGILMKGVDMTVEATTPTLMPPGGEVSLEPKATRPLAGELQFSVTSDSVVATATVTPSGPMRKILIAWGDGETSVLNSRPGLPTSPAEVVGDGDNQLPAGTYQLTHAYPETEDRMPVEYWVLLHVRDRDGGDEIDLAKVEITPRYRCTNYRTRVRLTGPCDPSTERTSEFEISMHIDGSEVHNWHWEPLNVAGSVFFVLEDSQISRELTVADGVLDVSFWFKETDLVQDDHLRFAPGLSATFESERVSENVVEVDGLFGRCDLIARFDREVSLIVPMPDSGHEVVFA